MCRAFRSIRPILPLLVLVIGACSQDATEPVPLAASIGSASDTECVGTLSGTFDNIVVPPGASCFLQAATVNGNVKALENSRLFFRSSTARGNIEGDNADRVDMIQLTNAPRNLVLGSIQIKEGAGFARVCGTDLPNGNIQIHKMGTFVLIGGLQCSELGGGNTLARGNIKVEENNIVGSLPTLPELDIRDNNIGGNVQVFKNVGPGQKTVQDNTVGEDLQCWENGPPFVGGPNTAGKAEGQCF